MRYEFTGGEGEIVGATEKLYCGDVVDLPEELGELLIAEGFPIQPAAPEEEK
jgi:hypothetical protein